MSIRSPYQHWLPGTEQNNSFWEGYKRGLEWPEYWKNIPGGPFIHSNQTSKECHLSWMEGWFQGKEKQCI